MLVCVSVLVRAMGVCVAAVMAVGVCVRSTRGAREAVDELHCLRHTDRERCVYACLPQSPDMVNNIDPDQGPAALAVAGPEM